MAAFDADTARLGLEDEVSLGSDSGGWVALAVDREEDALALTVRGAEPPGAEPAVEVTLLLEHHAARELHLWFTLALAAATWGSAGEDGEGPEMYDTQEGLLYPGELAVTYTPGEERPFTLEAIDYEETQEGVSAAVELSVADARELYPLLTMVVLAMGALS